MSEQQQQPQQNADVFQQKAEQDILKPTLPIPEDLQKQTTEMFTKVTNYLKGELSTTVSDYNLLIQMNNITSAKYHDMTEVTKGLSLFMGDLKVKYEEFQPYLDKINELDKNLGNLEKTVQLLDEYTKRLENKIKNIDKTALLQMKQQQSQQPQLQQQQQQQQQQPPPPPQQQQPLQQPSQTN
ncbi:biogenesis of lysosome-related organelles complex-1 [Tieghemostelium lacteum]|uniref:Biogenesis of lysosome-related organelles complex-1 n=1 Tax=Tieghemostelium lacteum TaxID=361077 RepID=A0A152A4G3_TIELA|nr:biogenesis of lysosome-related organelles complex-1 [Tieghemostelium lacteum]|eukprot:KYR00965.1 biogenesis of lysosome-related organelles complex-1 [Tieghemostelium lacteum]